MKPRGATEIQHEFLEKYVSKDLSVNEYMVFNTTVISLMLLGYFTYLIYKKEKPH